tara:strand:+ start:294 stop:440 length:147 start_codon:yes stop_codon:yes gene_type:complete
MERLDNGKVADFYGFKRHPHVTTPKGASMRKFLRWINYTLAIPPDWRL